MAASAEDHVGLPHGELVRLLAHGKASAQRLDVRLQKVCRPRVHAFQLDGAGQEPVDDLVDLVVGDVDLRPGAASGPPRRRWRWGEHLTLTLSRRSTPRPGF